MCRVAHVLVCALSAAQKLLEPMCKRLLACGALKADESGQWALKHLEQQLLETAVADSSSGSNSPTEAAAATDAASQDLDGIPQLESAGVGSLLEPATLKVEEATESRAQDDEEMPQAGASRSGRSIEESIVLD